MQHLMDFADGLEFLAIFYFLHHSQYEIVFEAWVHESWFLLNIYFCSECKTTFLDIFISSSKGIQLYHFSDVPTAKVERWLVMLVPTAVDDQTFLTTVIIQAESDTAILGHKAFSVVNGCACFYIYHMSLDQIGL